MAIALGCVLLKQPVAALAVALGADAYFRLGELLSLTRESFAAGRPQLGRGHRHATILLFPASGEVASKTLQYDESVTLDSPERQWLTRCLLAHVKKLQPSEVLFPFAPHQFLALFKQAAAMMGLGVWEATPHVLRHAGPSSDYLGKLRTLEDIRRRGRWASMASLRRYERASQMNARVAILPVAVIHLLELADRLVPEMLETGSPPPPELAVAVRHVAALV